MALTTKAKVWEIMGSIALLLSIAFYVFFYFIDISLILIVGMLLVLVTEKASTDFNRRMDELGYPKWKRRLYAYAQLFFWTFTFFLFIGGQIFEVSNLMIEVESHRDIGVTLLSGYAEYIPEALNNQMVMREYMMVVLDYITSILSSILSKASFYAFTGIIVIPLMLTAYFRDRDMIAESVYGAVPKKYRKAFVEASHDICGQLNDFLMAKLVECIVVGGICCTGFYVAGVKGWLFLGVLAGVFNIVPYIGPIMGAIPAIIIAFLDSPLTAALAVATIIVAQIIDSLYIYPHMIPEKVKIDPLWSVLLILIGWQLLGVYGMLFALPIYIVYKVVLTNSYKELVSLYPE